MKEYETAKIEILETQRAADCLSTSGENTFASHKDVRDPYDWLSDLDDI